MCYCVPWYEASQQLWQRSKHSCAGPTKSSKRHGGSRRKRRSWSRPSRMQEKQHSGGARASIASDTATTWAQQQKQEHPPAMIASESAQRRMEQLQILARSQHTAPCFTTQHTPTATAHSDLLSLHCALVSSMFITQEQKQLNMTSTCSSSVLFLHVHNKFAHSS